MTNKKSFVLESEEQVHDLTGSEVLSVNGRADIEKLQKRYPKIEVIVGKLESDDKPVKLDLVDMEHDRNRIIDAATETILGKRVDKIDKPIKFPFPLVTFVLGAMIAASVCMYIYGGI